MIKKFNEFISLNEAFQSSKLSRIIRQHGLPKYDWDKKMLYDLKDNEILGVAKDFNDYWDNFRAKEDGEQESFYIELKDGQLLVIGNLGILKSWWSERSDKEMEEIIKARRNERHKGNEWNGINKWERKGDTINDRFKKKKSEVEHRKNLEVFLAFLNDGDNMKSLIDILKDVHDKTIERVEFEEDKRWEEEFEFDDYSIGGRNIFITSSVEIWASESRRSYGAEYFDGEIEFVGYKIWDDDDETGGEFTDEELGITPEKYPQIYKRFEDEIEGDIYDYYDYYGVSRSDFV